jgi:hypothetical protein
VQQHLSRLQLNLLVHQLNHARPSRTKVIVCACLICADQKLGPVLGFHKDRLVRALLALAMWSTARSLQQLRHGNYSLQTIYDLVMRPVLRSS